MTDRKVPTTSQADTNTASKKTSTKKKLKIVGIVTGALLLLFVIIGATTSVVPEYSVDDLVPVTVSNIKFSRPVQWEDASYAENLKKDFGLDVSNASIFGDKVTKDEAGNYDIGNAAVVFGQTGNDTTDVAVLKTPEFKAKFEEIMNGQLEQDSFKSDTCVSISNFGKNYNYDYNGFPVSVAIKLNCRLSDEEQDNFKTESLEMRLAIVIAKDGKTYIYALIATDESWAKNEPVYFQMMEDLKAL
jgi:hypothetical protein